MTHRHWNMEQLKYDLLMNQTDASGLLFRHEMLTSAGNLLAKIEMGELCLKFVLLWLSEVGKETLLSFMLAGFTDEAALKEAEAIVDELDRHDEDEMSQWILGCVGAPVNGIKGSDLREYLKDLIQRDKDLTGQKEATP